MKEIEKITIKDKEYPESLKKIKSPPQALYFKGKLPQKEDLCFAIVGTRLCSDYGKQAALQIAGELSENNLIIVSGFAPGIDTWVHKAVVEKQKRTIAVLGTGLDEKSIYPKENIKLAEKIIELGGCLISEYPPGTRGTNFTFPQRNRIISGLSLGVLVIEAKEKSGSLITANWAFSQKRKVFAVPGPIYSLNSKGTNFLIKRGAKLVDNVNDILQELNLPLFKEKPQKEINSEEELILNALKEGPLHVDKIIKITKMTPSKIASIIAVLEVEEKVKNLGGNVYGLSC